MVYRGLSLTSRFIAEKSLRSEGDFRDPLLILLHLMNEEVDIPQMSNEFPMMSLRTRLASDLPSQLSDLNFPGEIICFLKFFKDTDFLIFTYSTFLLIKI